MPQIDLNERRALREATTVQAGERVYTLPVSLPASVMSSMLALASAQSDPAAAIKGVRDVYAVLFGGEHVDEALATIGLDEMQAIVGEAYGVNAGESLASTGP